MTQVKTRILLHAEETPKNFINIVPYLERRMDPPLNPKTDEPMPPEDLEAIFARECVRQEASNEKRISIPEEVREGLIHFSRPTPLQRAVRLEKYLKTPARIYFKREDVSPTGSHKLNTALTQAYYAQKQGVERLATETGAGQWGSAVALSCAYFELEAMIYMVRISYDQKKYRGSLMRSYGGEVVPSPSTLTEFGRKILSETPDHPGTLGIAISEALEDTMKSDRTKYTLGSVLNHVLLHQTIIGQETVLQLNMVEEIPDEVIGCVGGGSNFGGLAFPMLVSDNFSDTKFIAAEPSACPTLTRGEYCYDYGDTAGMTPKLKMYSLGASFTPPKIHAGGLRYHGVAPTISMLCQDKKIQAKAYDQIGVLEAGLTFAKTEGIIPAPESAHAIKAAIDSALDAKESGKEKVIVFGLSGHGHFDMLAYDALMQGKLENV
jgi:tryptophan synthase beta chain